MTDHQSAHKKNGNRRYEKIRRAPAMGPTPDPAMSTLPTIQHDGDTWNILSTGVTRDGKVYCHLASTTRGRHQKNGWYPNQIGDWIEEKALLSALIQHEEQQRQAYITAYYTDRANSGLAALTARRP